MKLFLTLIKDSLLIGKYTTISCNRTLSLPEDDKQFNLPAGFGRLLILRVEEIEDCVPEKWRKEGELIFPLYQHEALFLDFLERSLSLRLLVRVLSKCWDDAKEVCLELLHQNFVPQYAKQIQTILTDRKK